MAPPQFFVRPEAIEGGQVRFEPAEAHHLARVRRLRAGDVVEATDGQGARYRVRLDTVSPHEARGTLVGLLGGAAESPLAVTLAPALLRGERMAWLVQKATELGVARIWPILAARGVARPPAGGAEPSARWARVAREATKQCGRAVAPEVASPRGLADVVEEVARHDAAWLCQEGPGVPPVAVARRPAGPAARSLLLLVGPEGGFTPAEVEMARAAGATPVGLGPRVLRAESAALVALVLAQHLLGDLGRASGPGPEDGA